MITFKIKKLILSVLSLVVFYTGLNAQIMGLELLNGKSKIEIDFDYSAGFILLDLKFNNTLPLKFILDTGAEHIILFKKEISDLLGLDYEKRINLIGSDLDKEVYAYIIRSVPVLLKNCKDVRRDIIVLEEDFLHLEELTGESIHGIIGSRFFRGLAIEINYKKKKLILHDGAKFVAPTNTNFKKISVDIIDHKPYIQSSMVQDMNDTIPLNILMDTGAALPFLIFINTHPSLKMPESYIKGNLGKGLGGDLEGFLSRTNSLLFTDHFEFNNIITSFQEVDPRIDPEIYRFRNGLVGNPILERFVVILDFVNGFLYLKPHKNYNKEFEYDKSGLTIYAFGPSLSHFYIKDVVANSPAYEAGIRKGDMIKKIGIWPSNFFTLKNITKKLQSRDGKKIKMKLERNGVVYSTSFILRDILYEKP